MSKKSSRLIKLLEVLSGPASHVKIEVYYSLGGMNYFSGGSEARGIYLSVTPVTISGGEGYRTESYTGFSGTKLLVKEMARFNQKAIDTFVPAEEDIKRLLSHVLSKNNIVLKEETKTEEA